MLGPAGNKLNTWPSCLRSAPRCAKHRQRQRSRCRAQVHLCTDLSSRGYSATRGDTSNTPAALGGAVGVQRLMPAENRLVQLACSQITSVLSDICAGGKCNPSLNKTVKPKPRSTGERNYVNARPPRRLGLSSEEMTYLPHYTTSKIIRTQQRGTITHATNSPTAERAFTLAKFTSAGETKPSSSRQEQTRQAVDTSQVSDPPTAHRAGSSKHSVPSNLRDAGKTHLLTCAGEGPLPSWPRSCQV